MLALCRAWLDIRLSLFSQNLEHGERDSAEIIRLTCRLVSHVIWGGVDTLEGKAGAESGFVQTPTYEHALSCGVVALVGDDAIETVSTNSACCGSTTAIPLAALPEFRTADQVQPALTDGRLAQPACCAARPHQMRWR